MDWSAITDCDSISSTNAYALLLRALFLIPISHYLLAFLLLSLVFLYNFLEFHFVEDALTAFRGCPVALTYDSSSQIYNGVVSKCRILHGRYLATPWLSSPHIQTVFLNFFGRPPVFSYRRELFHASDGGTIALDWLTSSDVLDGDFDTNKAISRDDTTPIVVVIPGLTSDSTSAYLKHLAFSMAKSGWNVVVSNHRGLGGVSITSDCFYNAGWTEDIRVIVSHLHREFPKAPLFAIGTSIGANVLVKYLGEDGDNVPVAGAVAICSPWDLLIGDRFIRRRFLQKFYDRALTIGLQGYAQLHELRYSRLANWEGIKKSRSIRDFDNHATRLVGKFETVDTYYRRCSSAGYVGNVSVPLLCVSALDDPVCTREAIPWDECRTNKNVVLATLKHGGHLAFFEGITAARLWLQALLTYRLTDTVHQCQALAKHCREGLTALEYSCQWVRATGEFLRVLHSSQYMHVQNKILNSGPQSSLDSAIDQGPFVSVAEDGMVAAMGNDETGDASVEELSETQKTHCVTEMVSGADHDEPSTRPKAGFMPIIEETSREASGIQDAKHLDTTPVKRCLDLLRRQNRYSIWLLTYIAIITSWPLLGSALKILSRKKLKNVLPAALFRR
ncbi:Alpha/Beta hydrolase fold containing protein [Parasponia andersonii]|uniref:Alpha/Beta hydrolase fold containing protein n=1 Tax=Parasponia andersonii TaxID=3476 RepID=A0A2P5AIY6_PARAD|nr:Alpha/Beta hydrolase fold containing protein [Parasponia andersonii]